MESAGSLIDKLSINELKIFHMEEQKKRSDAEKNFVLECESRLQILREQKKDLQEELEDLLCEIKSGKRKIKVFRQMKMYNEKKFKD